MYHGPDGSMPADFHKDFSRKCVPELSPRETKRAPVCAIAFIACAADVTPLMPAGSFAGPMMTKSLYMTSRRLSILPSLTYFFSSSGACARTTSASPRAASASAWPVPMAIVFTVYPLSRSNIGTRTSRSPESCVLVVVDRMTGERAACAAMCRGAPIDNARTTTNSRRRFIEPIMRMHSLVSTSPWRPSSAKRPVELVLHRSIQGIAKSVVASQEPFGLGREPHPAPWAAAGRALNELEAGGALELTEIPPRIAIRHRKLFGRLLQRPVLLDELEEPRTPVTELQLIAERDPYFDFWFHGRLRRPMLGEA